MDLKGKIALMQRACESGDTSAYCTARKDVLSLLHSMKQTGKEVPRRLEKQVGLIEDEWRRKRLMDDFVLVEEKRNDQVPFEFEGNVQALENQTIEDLGFEVLERDLEEEKLREILAIESQVVQINDAQAELASLTALHSDYLDDAEDHLEIAVNNSKEATEELAEAERLANQRRKRKVIAGIVGVATAVVLLPAVILGSLKKAVVG